MKLLLVTPFPLYPTDTGGRIRTARIFERLAERHEVVTICFRPSGVSDDQLAKMRAFSTRIETVPWRSADHFTAGFYREVAASLASTLPYTVRKYRSRTFIRRVRGLLADGSFDVLVCDFLQPAINCIDLAFRPKVLFQHNVEAEIFRRHAEAKTSPHERALFRWEAMKLARFERRACRAFDSCIAVSSRDAELLRVPCGNTPVHVAPTGVDTEYFAPRSGAERPGTVLFLGSMDWLPNQDAVDYFVERILPVARKRLDLRFVVAGRNPSERLRRLARDTPGMTVTGTVDDMRPHLAEASLVVIPLRIGGGTRIKVYEAMAMERAVLSTSVGIEGLPVVAGEHVEVADDPLLFADLVVELLSDADRRQRLGAAGRRFVEEHASWNQAASCFAAICEETMQRMKETTGCD